MDVSKAPPVLQAKAAEMFPKARTSIKAAYEAGVKIAVGTDAPAIPHGRNADELVTLVEWGMSPAAVLKAATVTAAELINAGDRGRIAEDYWRISSPCRRSVVRHHRYQERQLRDERRQGLCPPRRLSPPAGLTTSSRSSSCWPVTR